MGQFHLKVWWNHRPVNQDTTTGVLCPTGSYKIRDGDETAPIRILSEFDQAKVPAGTTLQDKGLDMT